MEGLLAGDDDAIRALYARYGRPIYSLGLRLLGTRESAEELTQDVFLTAWRKATRFDPTRGRLSTWLRTIAHNLALDEEAVLIERDAAVRALSSLTEAERRLVARAYFRGMTAREIAETDGIPLGTVKTRLRSAMIKVRKANEGKDLL